MGIFLAIFNTNFKQSKLFICTLDMQIIYILNKMWCYFISHRQNRSENDLDAKYWIQNILLKNHIKSLNKSN